MDKKIILKDGEGNILLPKPMPEYMGIDENVVLATSGYTNEPKTYTATQTCICSMFLTYIGYNASPTLNGVSLVSWNAVGGKEGLFFVPMKKGDKLYAMGGQNAYVAYKVFGVKRWTDE